ncbi:uncharacterized protein LTR77_010152 [Saxophila tyrrhenica]|uniref:Uncharacterized protein n=1 Tax=Saxophila tyrrhenica TaxID=1690608 RepID=A0AAV9NWB0_9PEZI|nr:hypothetical protein LTR77_010152 [Saxophila tyrrhenica]
MSIQLTIALPLDTVVEMRQKKHQYFPLDDSCNLDEMLMRELWNATIKSVNDLPYKFVPNDDVRTPSTDDAEAVVKETVKASFESALDDVVNKMKTGKDQKNAAKESTKPAKDDGEIISITVRDPDNRDEKFDLPKGNTVADLIFAYAYRVGMPSDRFVLNNSGNTCSTAQDDLLEKVGIVDGTIIYAYPKYAAASAPHAFIYDITFDFEKPPKWYTDEASTTRDPVRAWNPKDHDGWDGAKDPTSLAKTAPAKAVPAKPARYSKDEHPKPLPNPLAKLDASWAADAHRARSTGHADRGAYRRMAVRTWSDSEDSDLRRERSTNIGFKSDTDNKGRPRESEKVFVITVRDLMNQCECFEVSKQAALCELVDRYSDRTGLDATSLRFKFPSGCVYSTDEDGEGTMADFGVEEEQVIVAMPDSINF